MRRFSAVILILLLLTGCTDLSADPLVSLRIPDAPPVYTSGAPVHGNTTVSDMPSEAVQYPELDPYLGLEITFLAVGDNLIHPNIYMDARKRGSAEKEYDFLPMYADVAEQIHAADFAFINQETVMAGESYGYSGYPAFNSPRQLGLDLVALGFDMIGMANNHMLDMGSAGLADTVRFWDAQPVIPLGASFDPQPVILEKDGVSIGLLAYTCHTNGIRQRTDAEVKVPYAEEETILADIAALREREADVILVSIHWGNENSSVPSADQKHLAQVMADAGVDVILGHHSHCLQPVEWLTGTAGNDTLCIYSLGNFVSGMAAPINQVGGLFTFSVVSDGMGGVKIDTPLLTPTVFYYGPNWFNTHVYLLEEYTDEIAATHGVSINGYTLPVEKARQIVTDVIDPQFLPQYLQ